MELIDFHAHIYPEKIAGKATKATGDFYGITPACSGTGEKCRHNTLCTFACCHKTRTGTSHKYIYP